MQPSEYETLASLERDHWWYRALHQTLVDAVRRLGVGAGAKVLDAGCGTGALAAELSDRVGITPFALDASPLAVAHWPATLRGTGVRGSVNRLPFRDASLDLVLSADVLCCQGVRSGEAIAEFRRVLRPGGGLVVGVPAYPWLSSAHDRAVHCVRRYTSGELRTMLDGWRLDRLTHLYPAFLPAIVLVRLARKRCRGVVRSDVRRLPGLLNRLMCTVSELERRGLARMDYPFGSTLLAIARKAA